VPDLASFADLCNCLSPGSFDSDEREVSFSTLNAIMTKSIGLFGYDEDVWRVLYNAGARPALVPDRLRGMVEHLQLPCSLPTIVACRTFLEPGTMHTASAWRHYSVLSFIGISKRKHRQLPSGESSYSSSHHAVAPLEPSFHLVLSGSVILVSHLCMLLSLMHATFIVEPHACQC
jgi:hypothetical protein